LLTESSPYITSFHLEVLLLLFSQVEHCPLIFAGLTSSRPLKERRRKKKKRGKKKICSNAKFLGRASQAFHINSPYSYLSFSAILH
jgi:hypothetical protein